MLAAIAAVNGISQVSNSAKIWIARPSPNKGGKSTILPVDWPAISKRGDNATNYAILPGDRLVFGEDALTTQSNLLGKKVVPLQRIAEIIAFMTSAMSEVQNTPGAAKLATQLVQGNLITDDARLNALFLDALHSAAEKPAGKAAAKPAPDQGTTSTDHVDNVVAIDDTEVAKSAAKTTVIVATRNALVLSGSTALEDEPKAVVPVASAPHELALQSLPAYRIEPPDMIQIDSSKPIAGNQPVNGQYLVGPDGTINLRKFGQVNISGKTVAEAKAAIEKQLRVFLNAPEVSVSVIAYNSKVYYIVTQGAGLGDSVRRLPITGNETVLDAIAQIKGLSQVSSTNISIVRPSAANPQEATVLSVDWGGVSRRGETATNYQIFPGDRIVVGQDSTVTASNMLAKKTASIERAAGIISVTANTVQSLNDAHGSGKAVQELLRKGLFDSDPDLKKCVEVLIRITEETKGPKAAPSPTGR